MEKIISLITGYKSYIISGIALVAVSLIAYEFILHKGMDKQALKTVVAEKAAIQEGVKGRGKIEQEINQLADPDLDSQLDRWMRD